ncbi:hypothetical protein HYS91_02940 [Candidatus Daviesbacteria bacterium]|nr:hypothetical protein [Candidatus Daviesbacteria bacterium]
MRLNSYLKAFTYVFLAILAAPLIYKALEPFFNWYLNKVPALGVDLFNSATHATIHLKHLSMPFNGFKDIWFGGYPLMLDFPQFTYYAMVPFASKYGAPSGVQIFALSSLFLFIFCCFLLFFRVSKNFGVAIFLAVCVLLSVNIYGSLTWAGSIPYFASQLFLPLGLLMGYNYLNNPSTKNLLWMSLVTALGFLIHPLGVLAFLIPSLLIMLVFGSFSRSYSPKKVIKHLFLFNLAWLFSAFVFTYKYLLDMLTQKVLLPSGVVSKTARTTTSSPAADAIANFYRDQINLLFTQTNSWLFIALILGLVLFPFGFFLARKKGQLFLVMPFLLIVGYSMFHPFVNLGGYLNLLRHDPYRAFWQFPVTLALLTAFLWGFTLSAVKERLHINIFFKGVNLLTAVIVSLAALGATYVIYLSDINKLIEVADSKSELSSAFPEVLSLNLKKENLDKIKAQVLPSFIRPDDKNKRLYVADQTVNIWWNSFFDVPLARGYIDPPVGTRSKGGFFWLDIGIANDTLVRDFKIEEAVALQNSLFLIDWYGIGYFEGGRLSSKGPSAPPSSYLLKNKVFDKEEEVITHGALIKYQTASGKPELNLDIPQSLRFYKVADSQTSPILYPTNASAVIIFTSDPGYEDILRIIASRNLNSKKIIPVLGGEYIDKYSLSDLKAFDAVIIHEYRYHNKNKAFSILERYVKEGGKVFIDTGAEVKESAYSSLPQIFPMNSLQRKGLGKSWEIQGEGEYLASLDLKKFGPLIFNEDEWKLSFLENDRDLRSGAKVILRHQGKPVLVERSLGSGKVVWSGLNLPYHYNQYKIQEEADMFINILKSFTNIDEKAPLSAQTKWFRPEDVEIKTDQKAKGILFKEQLWPGWRATLDGKTLPIYKVGPTFPGFMYVPINQKDWPLHVKFQYNGTLTYWIVAITNVVIVLFILEYILLDSKVLGRRIFRLTKRVRRKVFSWWEKEEEA